MHDECVDLVRVVRHGGLSTAYRYRLGRDHDRVDEKSEPAAVPLEQAMPGDAMEVVAEVLRWPEPN